MLSIPELDPFLTRLVKGESILDVGCGSGKLGYFVKACNDNKCTYVVGADIQLELLRFVKEHKLYDDVVLADGASLPFRTMSFDTVVAAEIIEHLHYEQGMKMLDEVERVARVANIVTTPAPRAVFSMSKEHITSWPPSLFRKRGYMVCGIRALPMFHVRSRLVRLFVTLILVPLSFYFPSLATDVIAYKVKDSALSC